MPDVSAALPAVDGFASTANAALGAVSSAVGLFDSMYAKVERVRARQLSAENWLRAYYFEVIGNLELLDAIDLKKVASLEPTAPAFRKLIARIETEIGLSILFSENLDPVSGLYRLLKTKGRMDNRGGALLVSRKGRDEPFPGKALYESVLQAISFTVVKTEVLRKLASFDEDERELANRILLRRRLVNIRERFLMIKNVMDGFEGIRDLSR